MPTPNSGSEIEIWRKSRRSENGHCVEVALLTERAVALRDSKDREGPVLRFSSTDWSHFVADLREGAI